MIIIVIFTWRETNSVTRQEHIDIRHHFVWQDIEEKQIQLEHVTAEHPSADLLTKALPINKFEDGRKALGIRDIHG